MGVYIDGWIEVASDSGEWQGVARTNFVSLNGGRNRPILYEFYELGTKAVLPGDFSPEVLHTFDNTYGSNLYIIRWEEIVLANWNEASVDYFFLLDLMRVFVDYHGEDKVRLVCWSS